MCQDDGTLPNLGKVQDLTCPGHNMSEYETRMTQNTDRDVITGQSPGPASLQRLLVDVSHLVPKPKDVLHSVDVDADMVVGLECQ